MEIGLSENINTGRSASGSRPLSLALGFFDCMHLGHRAVVEKARRVAENTGAQTAVFTFSSDLNLTVKHGEKQLYPLDERLALYAACGVERVIAREFTEHLMTTDRRDFLDELTSEYDVAALVCGADYTFGFGGAGDARFLTEYCRERGIAAHVVPLLETDGKKVSSGRIKSLLAAGEIKAANALLGAPFSLSGEVVRGRGEGHLFGIPTANIAVPEGKFLPARGVYSCRVSADGKEYKGVVNVGDKPTFGDGTTSVEALIGDFEGDLYGKKITVFLTSFLREIRRFSSPEELARQVKSDLSREV